MSNAGVGGLYLEVKLDVKPAIASLRQLEAAGRKAIAGLTGNVRFGDAVKAEADKAAKAVSGLQKQQGGAGPSMGKGWSPFVSAGEVAKSVAAAKAAGRQMSDVTSRVASDTAKNAGVAGRAWSGMQGVFGRVSRSAGTATGRMGASVRGLSQLVRKDAGVISKGLLTVGSGFGGIAAAAQSGNVGLSVKYAFSGLLQSVKALGAAGPVAGSAILAIGAALGAVVVPAAGAAAALKKVWDVGFQAGNNLEATFTAFKATLGKMGEAETEFLSNRAESSIFDLGGLADVDRTLLAYNVLDTEIRQGAIDALITLGTVGGKSVDELRSGAIALGQAFQSGSLRGTEVLQLVNSVGVGLEVFKELPKYAAMTLPELRKMQEEGLLPSVDLFAALEARAASYGSAVADSMNTVQAQMGKLRTDLPNQIGAAFLGSGVQDAVGGFLAGLYGQLSSIDWSKIAGGFKNAIDGLGSAWSGFLERGGGNAIRGFFETVLPQAIGFVGSAFASVGSVMSVVFDTFRPVLHSIGEMLGWVKKEGDDAGGMFDRLKAIVVAGGKAFLVWLEVMRLSRMVTNELLLALGNLGQTLWDVGKALTSLITFDIDGMKKSFSNAWGNVQDIADGAVRGWNRLSGAIDEVKGQFKDLEDASASGWGGKGKPFKGFDWGDDEPRPGEIPGMTATTDVADKANAAAQKANSELQQNLTRLKDHIESLRQQAMDLTTRWFGMRSELEAGLLGDSGFTASASQIAAMGKQLVKLFRDVGDAKAADAMDKNTRILLRLADQRDKIAERLKDAETKLKEAVDARDSFAAQVKQQTRDFVNALSLEEETVEKVSKFSIGGVTGYVIEQSKKTKSFIEAQRARLADVKEFTKRINSLAAKGLDAGLLEQLVNSGPEQALEVVRQLDQGGVRVISEANQIQRELGQVATKHGNTNAERFRAAAVKTAQGQVKGLKSQAKSVENAAKDLADRIYRQVTPLVPKMEALGKQVGAALANAIAAGARMGEAAANQSIARANAAAAEANRRAQYETGVSNLAALLQARIQSIESGVQAMRKLNVSPVNLMRYQTQQYAAMLADIGKARQTNPEVNVYIGDERIKGLITNVMQVVNRGNAIAAAAR